ncbi:MAG: methyltransferase domain-containing protein [Colwellia sp.]|nr:methyltransferase domain-containing protein [Colwellia sp.]
MSHSPLIEKYIRQLQKCSKQAPILDLACGSGRNGLFLVNQHIPVVFADVKTSALEQVKNSIISHQDIINSTADFWQVDFEQDKVKPLVDKSFSAILVFRYFHRPLFAQIKQAVIDGGMVIYETFTVEHVQFGRPKNPNFLLKHGELAELFSDWHILHSFEGIIDADNDSGKQAIAQIVARKR